MAKSEETEETKSEEIEETKSEETEETITLTFSEDTYQKLEEMNAARGRVGVHEIIGQAIGTEYYLFSKLHHSKNKLLLQEGDTITELRFKNYRSNGGKSS